MTSDSGQQLRLVVWKNLLLRKRRPVILALEVLWPVLIFGLLVGLRLVLPANHQDACYYNARALPSAGGLPLIQGLICNIDNQCLNRTQYEDIPTYPGSRLDSLVGAVSPLFHNEKLLGLAKELPTSALLLDTITSLLSHDSVKQLLVTGIPVENLVTDVDEAKAVVLESGMTAEVVDGLLASRLSLPSLVYALIAKNAACDESLIRNIIISPDPRVARELSSICPFSAELREGLQQVLNVEEVIQMISRVAEALDQTQMAAQVAELTDLVRLAVRLNFGSENRWSEVVRYTADVLRNLSDKTNIAFLRGVWKDWGQAIFPRLFSNIETVINTLVKSFQKDSAPVYTNSELKEFVAAVDTIIKAASSSEGRVHDALAAVSGSVEDLAHGLAVDADWLNIMTHWLGAEAKAVAKSHTFPYLPRIFEAAALTLSDSKKLSVLLERRYGALVNVEMDVCDPDVFDDLIVHSGEARVMSHYACVLLKEVLPAVIDKTVGGVTSTYQRANTTSAQEAIGNGAAFLRALFKASPYDFRGKIDGTIRSFVTHTWHGRDDAGRAELIAAVVQLVHDFVKQTRATTIMTFGASGVVVVEDTSSVRDYVDGVIGAVSSLVTVLNRHISEVAIKDGRLSLASIFGDVVSLQRTVNLVADNVDRILVTLDHAMVDGLNTSSSSSSATMLDHSLAFCSDDAAPLASYLLEDTVDFAGFEKKFCAAAKQIVPEMSTAGPTKDILAVLGYAPAGVSRAAAAGSSTTSSWKELARHIVELKTTVSESAGIDSEALLKGLEPLQKLISGLRVLMAVPATETEAVRLKLRALEYVVRRIAPRAFTTPIALRLTHELAELSSSTQLATTRGPPSLLRWAEDNLPTFTGLLLDTRANHSDALRMLVNNSLADLCLTPVTEIFSLPEDRDVRIKIADAFNELCELGEPPLAADEKDAPFDVVIRRLFNEIATYTTRVGSGQVESKLFRTAVWTAALERKIAESGSPSIESFLMESLTQLTASAGFPLPNAAVLSSYNCSIERTLHPREGSLRRLIWNLLKDSTHIVEAGLAAFMQPTAMKHIVPLVKPWTTKSAFCLASDEDLERLGVLLGKSVASPLKNLRSLACAGSGEIAKEFSPCKRTEQVPELTDVIVSASQHLNKKIDVVIDGSSFSLSSWTNLVSSLGNLFKNTVIKSDLEEPASWITLFEQAYEPYPHAYAEVKALILSAGAWAKHLVSEGGSDPAAQHVVSVLRSVDGQRAFEAAMWFLATEQNDVIDFSLATLNETYQLHCGDRRTEMAKLICNNETQSLLHRLQQEKPHSSNASTKPQLALHQAAANLLSLLDKIDSNVSDSLAAIFEREASKYQHRVLHGLSRVLLSSLWWTPMPDRMSSLLDRVTTLNEVIEILPSANVTNFFVDDFASASADFSQLPVSGDRPLEKLLVRNLVPIGAGLEKSETILLNFWNSQDLLVKVIYPKTTCEPNKFVTDFLGGLESPAKAMCQIAQGGLQAAYRYFMDVGLSSLATNTSQLEGICIETLWDQLARWSRMTATQAQLASRCATDLRHSNTAKETAHVARTAAVLVRLTSKFSRLKSGPGNGGILLNAVASQLPVYARLENIVKNQSLLSFFDTIDPRLRDTFINVRWLSRHRSASRLRRLFCKDRVTSFIRFPDKFYPKALCGDEFVRRFVDAIDFHVLHLQIPPSQNESLYTGLWLRPLLQSRVMEAIEAIARYSLPFVQLAEEPLNLDTVTALLVSLKAPELQELRQALERLENPINEAFVGSETDALVHAFRRAVGAIAEMASTGLFDVRFNVVDVLDDPESAKNAIMNALNTNGYFVDLILSMQFDISSFLVDVNTRKLTFVDVVGDLTLLKRAFNLPPSSVLLDKYSKVLKQAVHKLGIPPNPLVTVAQQKLLKNIVDILLEKTLQKNNLGWDNLVAIFSAFTSAPEIVREVEHSFGVIKDVVGLETIKGLSNLNVSSNGVRVLAHPVALKLVGKLVCGRPLRALEKEFKILQPSDKEPQLNEAEIQELPKEFCRTGYEQVMRLTGGPIIWGFLKPILRGKLLYAPDTEEARLIVSEVNKTFEMIGTLQNRLYDWGDASNGLKMMLGRKDAITNVKDALFSSVLEPLVKRILPEGLTAEAFDFRKVEEEVGDPAGLVDMLQLIANISHCFTLDRFHAVPTETELEFLAPQMTRRKEFIAAFVFDLPSSSSSSKRSARKVVREMREPSQLAGRIRRGFWEMIGFVDDDTEPDLPHDIRYKIRMDIDNVPLTHRLKDLFWKPGAKADFFEDMRYQRGFSQMQQLIDSAIVSVLQRQRRSEATSEEGGEAEPPLLLPASFVQQFPYPCYENDTAGHLIKSIVPVACLLSWLFCVAFLIRQRVLDREQHLQEVLAVMGLKPWVDVIAWVLLSGTILSSIVFVTTAMTSYILPNSDFCLLLVFYLAFAMSILSFCYLVSNILQNNSTLAALTGTLLYILSFIPFVVTLTSEATLGLGTKLLLCTSMSSAFCYGSLYITRFEQQTLGLTWNTAFSSPLAADHMHFMYALGMLLLDTLVYAVVGWYCGHVFNNNPILRKKWHFIFQREFLFGNPLDEDDVLSVDEKADGVTISNLAVRFASGNTAVNGLSLKLRDGEITSLLGQNGAGKTTTIRVLTGQCRATGGYVQAYGIDSRNLRDLRRLIGYCPQYNTLFDKLTVREHFQFFAKLKCPANTSEEQIDNEVSAMLHMMDLAHLENRLSCELSGGLQRRLCVGLSFIGGSKLIILDEPTSSVDPVARRQIWDLVLKYRKRRTILLTTHHMDEADILSDRVAIIHKGNLLCEGSPITLKTRFGCGYKLAVSRNTGRGSDSGLSTSDASLTSNNFSVDLIDDIREFVPSASILSDEADQMVINLPHRSEQGEVYDFASLFEKLDTSALLGYHGFSNYRVTSTTLEDAFLNLCSDGNQNLSISSRICQEFESVVSDGSTSPGWDSASTNSLYLTSNDRIHGVRLLITQLRALLYKRTMHSARNWKVLFSSVVMPCIFIALAMGISTLKPDSIKEPSLDLDVGLYGTPALSVLSGPEDHPLWAELIGANPIALGDRVHPLRADGFCPAVDRARRNLDWNTIDAVTTPNETQTIFAMDPSEADLTDYLLATYAEFADKRYGGWSLTGGGKAVKIWYDNTAHHSLPIYQNQLTNAFLRTHFGDYTVRVVNHPLHLTQEQLGRETFLSRLADLGVALVILVGLGFIPASAVIYVVRERVQEEKTVQHCSGVAKPVYWAAVYLWDLLVLLVATTLCGLVIHAFGIPVYVGRSNFAAVIILLLLFGFSSVSLTQITSHLFSEPSIAFMVTYCLNLLLGLAIFLLLLLCYASWHDAMHAIGLLVPQYAFVQGILLLFKNHITADIYDIFDQDVYEDPVRLLALNYWAMLAVGVVSWLVNILIDCNLLTLPLSRKELVLTPDEDADVMMERKRVVSAIGDDILSLINLSKDYKSFGLSKPHRAVDNVSFGVGKGVCFGLLGLNGAGKTTLFKILTGHVQPTSGRAFLKEKTGTYRSLADLNHHVGYCPQSDAVDDLLTPRQQLTIYARLKGIEAGDVDEVVQKALNVFRLQAFADRQCVALSRGTRRKVCTAMAFLGDPQLVLLDEPTTGMDPVTRRLLWNSVHRCVDSGRSVLLTSHSMEECDALCHRLGIMAHGRLRCIGCPDALKYRFSQGYTLALRIEPDSDQQVLQYVTKRFPSGRLKSLHATSLHISVSSKEASLSTLFALLQDPRSRQAGLVDFAVQQTTLDQVFVEFAMQQRGEEDDEEAFSRVATVSSFGSASYQQLSSKESGGQSDSSSGSSPNDDPFIDSTHF